MARNTFLERREFLHALSAGAAAFAVPGVFAQQGSREPIIGTWLLNTESVHMDAESGAFKVQTEVYREIGGHRIELTASRTRSTDRLDTRDTRFLPKAGMMRVEQGEGFDPEGFVSDGETVSLRMDFSLPYGRTANRDPLQGHQQRWQNYSAHVANRRQRGKSS